MKKHAIIGNSAAALSAIQAIRRTGDSGPIALIAAEPGPAYSPVLTTYYIAGSIERRGLFLVDEEFYRRMNVQTFFGRRALEIDSAKRWVRLNDRTKVAYDDLLIATGAFARTLERVAPEAAQQVTVLRTLADAERIKKASRGARQIVVIGAGLVSLQSIKALRRNGLRITALVSSHQVLSQQMDAESAALIQRRLEAGGVELFFGREVRAVTAKAGRVEVKTNYNEILPADLVIVGKGVQPNVGLARSADLNLGEGILVDGQMRTNRSDIYAAGDVAAGQNSVTGKVEVIATWTNACAQGEIAGMNMAGRPAVRQGQFRENVTNLMGMAAAAIGLSNPGRYTFEERGHTDPERGECRKLYFDGSVLVGALLIGRIEDAGVLRSCIANRVDLAPWKESLARRPLTPGTMLGQIEDWPFLQHR